MSLAVAKNPAERPNFVVSLYGALLDNEAPPAGGPPLFIVAAQDDAEAPPLRSVEMFERWTRADLPAELHLYERGGHGFALRRHNQPADDWTTALEAWLSAHGFIRSPKVNLRQP